MKIFVLFLLVATGCALDQQVPVVPTAPKVIETTNVVGLKIERPSDDGRFVFTSVINENFTTPLTVSRGPCHYGKDCVMWLSPDPDKGIQTKVIQEDWKVILIEASIITVAK